MQETSTPVVYIQTYLTSSDKMLAKLSVSMVISICPPFVGCSSILILCCFADVNRNAFESFIILLPINYLVVQSFLVVHHLQTL